MGISICNKDFNENNMNVTVDRKLYATDFWGRKFNVDAENGKLIDVKIVR